MVRFLNKYIKNLYEDKNFIESFKKIKKKQFLISGAGGLIGRYITIFLLELNKSLKLDNIIIANSRNKKNLETVFAEYLNYENFLLLANDSKTLNLQDIQNVGGGGQTRLTLYSLARFQLGQIKTLKNPLI